eukprot:TRINITY_DN14278_c0_g1_i2.p2 TRINITY_DN14278_c0_g1~~TRINITY_DN14278_c0_g1_i2.p2  ORF type:complete len:225 (-),score=44.82 TRINITY_DN14278_c0_g1_i2:149-823(-)
MNMNKEYDYLFKIVIIGNSGVGKSSILMRFTDDQFKDSYLATIGVDFRFKTIEIDEKKVKLQIWDTAGQERFRTITSAYYKGADGIIIVFDSTNEQSFTDIESYWLNELNNYAEKNVELLLLGNKSDLNEEKVIKQERAQDLAQQKNLAYFETSAKTADCIQNAFSHLANTLILKKQILIEEKKKRKHQQKQQQSTKGKAKEKIFDKKERAPPPVALALSLIHI